MSRTSETDIASLQATLCAQQNLLQELYNELDAEREASASAVSEALSVILRLQGEKAAVTMEAEQYRRLSEEKMCHAEESLAITEDIIYQKEMEISALDSQVQAYRHKLMSMGCFDDFRDNPFQEKEDLRLGRRDSESTDYSFDCMDTVCERGGSPLREMDTTGTYSEQIRKLDVQVKEISNRACNNTTSLRNGDGLDYPCSPSVHDIFEVPQSDRKSSSWVSQEEYENGMDIKDVENKLHGKKLVEKVLKSKELCGPSYHDSIECRMAIVDPPTSNVSESQHGLCQLNGISGIDEVGWPTESTERDKELKLLNEIKEGLNYLHDEIKGLKVKKLSKKDEPSLRALSEAMLYFWI